jgi:hypothetical protein
MKRKLNSDIPLTLAAIFLVIDYFAFQKELPRFIAYLLTIIPILILASTGYIWAVNKQFPFWKPFFPNIDVSPDWNNVWHAILFGTAFVFLAIVVTIQYFLSR